MVESKQNENFCKIKIIQRMNNDSDQFLNSEKRKKYFHSEKIGPKNQKKSKNL